MLSVVAVAEIVMGLAIAVVWTYDIIVADQFDTAGGRLSARDASDGSLLLPHWIAEYATAGLLVIGGSGLLADASWATVVAAFAAGALGYTSINSLGWALADRSRLAYAVPMAIGVVVGGVSLVVLLLGV